MSTMIAVWNQPAWGGLVLRCATGPNTSLGLNVGVCRGKPAACYPTRITTGTSMQGSAGADPPCHAQPGFQNRTGIDSGAETLDAGHHSAMELKAGTECMDRGHG